MFNEVINSRNNINNRDLLIILYNKYLFCCAILHFNPLHNNADVEKGKCGINWSIYWGN